MTEYTQHERDSAARVVRQAIDCGRITAVRGAESEKLHTCPVEHIAERGLPQLLEVPYGTERVRALIKELAELYVDCGVLP